MFASLNVKSVPQRVSAATTWAVDIKTPGDALDRVRYLFMGLVLAFAALGFLWFIINLMGGWKFVFFVVAAVLVGGKTLLVVWWFSR